MDFYKIYFWNFDSFRLSLWNILRISCLEENIVLFRLYQQICLVNCLVFNLDHASSETSQPNVSHPRAACERDKETDFVGQGHATRENVSKFLTDFDKRWQTTTVVRERERERDYSRPWADSRFLSDLNLKRLAARQAGDICASISLTAFSLSLSLSLSLVLQQEKTVKWTLRVMRSFATSIASQLEFLNLLKEF